MGTQYLVTMQEGLERDELELAMDRLMSTRGVYAVKRISADDQSRPKDHPDLFAASDMPVAHRVEA